MDRIEAMKIFIAALDEGSLAGASRRTGRSPAAVSRAIAYLEAHVGVPLLHRTTRSSRLSEAGERYAAACRRVLAELDEADRQAAGERSVPRGRMSAGRGGFATAAWAPRLRAVETERRVRSPALLPQSRTPP